VPVPEGTFGRVNRALAGSFLDIKVIQPFHEYKKLQAIFIYH